MDSTESKKTFLICPVRGVDVAESEQVVHELEKQGFTVHWPHRDTNQDDNTGLRICRDNRAAIRDADFVHVLWDGKSQGSLFDLGMAFALGKIVIPVTLPATSPHKSFQNMVMEWSIKGSIEPTHWDDPRMEILTHGDGSSTTIDQSMRDAGRHTYVRACKTAISKRYI